MGSELAVGSELALGSSNAEPALGSSNALCNIFRFPEGDGGKPQKPTFLPSFWHVLPSQQTPSSAFLPESKVHVGTHVETHSAPSLPSL